MQPHGPPLPPQCTHLHALLRHALPACECLELFVGLRHAVAAHHRLDGLSKHLPAAVKVLRREENTQGGMGVGLKVCMAQSDIGMNWPLVSADILCYCHLPAAVKVLRRVCVHV
jgi:hypothetical protein